MTSIRLGLIIDNNVYSITVNHIGDKKSIETYIKQYDTEYKLIELLKNKTE